MCAPATDETGADATALHVYVEEVVSVLAAYCAIIHPDTLQMLADAVATIAALRAAMGEA